MTKEAVHTNVSNDNRGKRVAILQSCYIPWKGYFDIIGSCDIFVVYDDVQYRKNHWHNRNIIKTQHGTKWLTVPVSKAGSAFAPIDSVRIAEKFAETHWRTIAQSYSRAPFFPRYGPMLEALYKEAEAIDHLSSLNILFLKAISSELGFDTRFVLSSTLEASGGKTDRLVEICRKLQATNYLSGPSATAYLETGKFDDAGIVLQWMDYSGYPEYKQLHGGFEHAVSIIDLLMNVGPQARNFMKAQGGLHRQEEPRG